MGPNAVLLVLGEGQDQRNLWLEFSIDVLCRLEELLDMDAMSIIAKFARTNRLGFTRAILWGALSTHQPALDLKAAGELLRLPGKEAVREKLFAAIQKAFPAPAEAGAQEDAEPGETTAA